MTRELTSLAREMVKTGASADSELGQKLRALGGQLAESKEQVVGFKEKLKSEGGEGEGGFLAGMKENLEGDDRPYHCGESQPGRNGRTRWPSPSRQKRWSNSSRASGGRRGERAHPEAARLTAVQVQQLAFAAKMSGGSRSRSHSIDAAL